MKKLALAALALTFSIGSMAGGGDYKVDAKKSTIHWTGEKVTGKHEGFISAQGGEVKIDGKAISGKVTVDMASITCTDLDADYGAKLIGHLKSDDFFGVEKNPTANFVFKSWKKLDGDNYEISGDLTVKGKSHPAKYKALVTTTEGGITIVGDLTFDRAKYDIRYGSGSFFDDLGDKTIYDEVKLKLNIVATK
ncbi:MAG: polyisoprenoid-binding protein YceI [Sphingobacteriales bacterium]|jgi:polyisoprenoid-binding protein YceI